jgi:hypothetical protein
MSKELYEAAERAADACLDITEDLGKKEIKRRWHVFDELKERLSDAEDEQLTDYWRAGVKKRTK